MLNIYLSPPPPSIQKLRDGFYLNECHLSRTSFLNLQHDLKKWTALGFTYYSSTQDNLQADDYGQKARIKEGLVKRQSHLQVLTLQLSPLSSVFFSILAIP
jgi:hypothetical protein